MNNFIFNIQIARYNHKGQTYRAYIVCFAPKDSNQCAVWGAFDSREEAEEAIKKYCNWDDNALKAMYDDKCSKILWHSENLKKK